MSLKKVQEKCKKKIGRTRLPCTLPNRFALPSTTTKNKSIPTKRKSYVPFYMITNARISNFNFWIHVVPNQFALPSTTTKNKSIPTTRKSHVTFYMNTNARISNFNFWIHVMLNSSISLGDLAVYNWCSRAFWSSIIYEHFTPPCEHIYCRLPYGLNLNQFSLFEYDCCQVIQ